MNANTKIALLEARLRKLEVRKKYNSGVQQKIRRQILKLQRNKSETAGRILWNIL